MKKSKLLLLSILWAYRLRFKVLFLFAPKQGVKSALSLFATPRIKKQGEKERNVLAKAVQKRIKFEGLEIQTYQWGESHKTALLVHGWEGHAGNLGAFVAPMLEKGYQVVAFDGPAHGKSSGKQTNFFQFSDLVKEFINTHKPEIIFTHSFGSATSIHALHKQAEHPVQKMVLLTTPDKLEDTISGFTKLMHINKKGEEGIIRFMEARFGQRFENLRVSEMAQTISLEQMLIVHGQRDKILPVKNARKLAEKMPESLLLTPPHLGHYKILWDPEVIKEVSAFVQGKNAAPARANAHV